MMSAAAPHALVDTHAHLDHEMYDEDRDEVIARAKEAGLVAIVTIGTNVATSEAAVRLAEAHDTVYATVGIHPHEAKTATPAAYERLRALARHPRVVGIGEIGLDYHYDHSPRPVQREVFATMLGMARETGLPFVVHNREASDDVMAVLREHGRGLPGLLHAFTGSRAMAAECLDMGYHLSTGGMVTFNRAENIREVVADVPLERLLLETDAPYLTPVPLRGRRNEPAYVTHVARFLADLLGEDEAHIARTTTRNALQFFNIPQNAG